MSEEKACPFCAETIKVSAVKCRFCGEFLDGSSRPAAAVHFVTDPIAKKKPGCLKTGCTGFGLFYLLVMLSAQCSHGPERRRDKTPPATPPPVVTTQESRPSENVLSVGEDGTIDTTVFCAVDDAAWEALEEVAMAKDEVGAQRLMLDGKIFPLEPGDRVKILDLAWTTYKVRVVDGAYAGQAGWVNHDAVRR